MTGLLRYSAALLLILLTRCNSTESENLPDTLFQLLTPGRTGIGFVNQLDYTEELNTYTFKNFYNGGGVGLGDFNNDGLLDIFFSGNRVSNRLYLNQGGLKFTDITESAGLYSEGSWTTGVSIADINGDGLQDIYLCKSGPPQGKDRKNQLFINNGDLTFKDKAAEYGLDFKGLSTHASFFDFDNDGDLDCYLLNNSIRSVGGYDLRKDQRKIPDPLGGNKLLRNDEGKFIDVSQPAGIYTSEIGFGLGVTIGDINLDGWADIYVSNDFFEKDYLYINNQDGSFRESLEDYVREISMGSMGADMADINNDGLPDIFVTEMLPESDERLKTTAQFENWDKYMLGVSQGYGHQFGRNVLQLNNGDGTFSEIGRLAGVHATDWSWGALIFDMDNDGNKDIFVANGIYKDLLNQDYVNFVANQDLIREILLKEKNIIKRLVDSIPSNQLSNYAFKSQRNFSFSNKTLEWGFGKPTHSSGSAYGDLDNDGDLDLVLNNVNMPSFVYQNQSKEKLRGNSISFAFKGPNRNTFGLGTKITLKSSDHTFYQELSPMRGFISTVDHRLHFGLGNVDLIDSILVEWPGGRVSELKNVKANQLITLKYEDSKDLSKSQEKLSKSIFASIKSLSGIDFRHVENDFNDFDRDRLLFNMVSNEGPCLCVADVNGDKLEDFYIGGAKGQSGNLFIQRPGGFEKLNKEVFELDRESEDTGCLFFDANGDNRPDLYVASGGVEFSSSSIELADRLYINVGNGKLQKSAQILPVSNRFESTAAVTASDYDRDGDLDLFVGVRLTPFSYGVPGNGYLLNNDGHGIFSDVTLNQAPQLLNLGLITDAEWGDFNKDGWQDLFVAGEWMPLHLFINKEGRLIDQSIQFGLDKSDGWYHSLELADLNKDGWLDLVVGNHGLNSQFKASRHEPISLYINDFDQNGTIEQVLTRYNQGISYPLVLRNDLVSQMPYLKKKFLHFRDYKQKKISDIFTEKQLEQSIVLNAYTLSSAVWMNREGKKIERIELPIEAQFSPVYSTLVQDFDGDTFPDILLGGNLYRAKPETGIYDGSYGLLLKGQGDGTFSTLNSQESGISIKGEIRSFGSLTFRGRRLILVARNNDSIKFLNY